MKRLVQLIAEFSSSLRDPGMRSPEGRPPKGPEEGLISEAGESEILDCTWKPHPNSSIEPAVASKSQDQAVRSGQDRFLSDQFADGFWVGELEADTSLTSEYLMLRRILGRVDPVKEKKAVHYLVDHQLSDGGWSIFYGGSSNISSSVKAYFALKLCGFSSHETLMQRARENILDRGGVKKANVFTKIGLAQFGQYPWENIPLMPPELILLPNWFYFNLYEVSYWSRAVIVPLLIIYDKKPLCVISKDMGIAELYKDPSDQLPGQLRREGPLLSWKNFFVTVDRVLKQYDRVHLKSLRSRALETAKGWLLDHMKGSGGLGGIYPAMANSVAALRCMGFPEDDPLVMKGFREIEELEIQDEDSLHIQPCHSPIWDTSLTMNALLDTGLAQDHPALRRAAAWLLSKQTKTSGDWTIKRPKTEPGGWYFQYENEFYPDNDDAAIVLMALAKVKTEDEAGKREAILRGLRWLLAMQCRDGGWGSFDIDNQKMIFNQIPFADHGALLDPSTCDLAGRVLEALGTLGYDRKFRPAADALRFIRRNQEPDGSWYGRWGVNYIYGTWSVLAGLYSIGEDMREPYVRNAVDWLKGKQNVDGGWGESCESYVDRSFSGVGRSTASQTAWAILGLLKAGEIRDPAVRRGIDYLLSTQNEDGTWDEPEFTGTGFPGVFYLRYHMYRNYFPLWAIGLYQSLRTRGRTISDDVRIINRLNGTYRI